MRIKFWGVRGSIPAPLTTSQLTEKLFQALSAAGGVNLSQPAEVRAFIAGLPPAVRSVVGGNTTCVEIDTGRETIIIDCGSGMRSLGLSLMAREFGRGQGVAHIFLTHAHWDHLQGLPFFTPAYVPGNRLIFYAVNQHPRALLEHQQTAPTFFPIPPDAMLAHKEYVTLGEAEPVRIGGLTVSSLALDHPGVSHAYRFDDGESVFVFASDGEYKSLGEANLRRYVDFFANADALAFDSQFSLRDVFLSKADWGHSSAIIGVDIAERARAKRLITFHHDPTHSDDQIYAIADGARRYALVNDIQFNTEVIVAIEGLELFLGRPPGLTIDESRQDGLIILSLSGHLDGASAAEANARLQAALSAAPRLLLDLTPLSAADALGMKQLLDAAAGFPDARLAVLAPQAHVRRLAQQAAPRGLHVVRSRAQADAVVVEPAHQRLAGAVIGGRYQLDALWFVDEQGAAYRGRSVDEHSPIVARVAAGAPHDPLRRQFVDGLRAWQTLSHPHLQAGLDLVEAEDWAAIVCPAPPGAPLRDLLAAQPPWPARWRLAGRLCHALAAMHHGGVTHGGLRPAHVFAGADSLLVSLAALVPAPASQPAGAYLAPEQLRRQPASPRSDVYALGVLLYELLLGAHPFAAESRELQLTLQLFSLPQSPRSRWPDIPAPLEEFLLRLLAPDPLDRPPDAAAVAAAFEALAFSEP